ncbi:MAG: hypothetical protein MZV64_71100 [Ignavibacteriales bacterium]|nr:hypothetical protein [Ignavibacteriales bacterium]
MLMCADAALEYLMGAVDGLRYSIMAGRIHPEIFPAHAVSSTIVSMMPFRSTGLLFLLSSLKR